jgi:hypothetical protein
MMTGSADRTRSARIARVSSSPSSSGISRSVTTSAISGSRPRTASASRPSRAVTTGYPAASRMLRWSSRTVNESSTTRTLGAAACLGSAGTAGPGVRRDTRMSMAGSMSSAIRPSPRMAAPRYPSTPPKSGPSGLTTTSCWPNTASQVAMARRPAAEMRSAGTLSPSGAAAAPTRTATSMTGSGRPRTSSAGWPSSMSVSATTTISSTATSGTP